MPRLTSMWAALAAIAFAPVAESACPTAGGLETPEPGTSEVSGERPSMRAQRSVSASCLVRTSASMVLDVRPASARARVRIDDAMVIELSGLPGWASPGSPVTLVGTGLNQGELLLHCQQLQTRGISASVLDGGAQHLPAERRTPSSPFGVAEVDTATVIEALRAERGVALVAIGAVDLDALRAPLVRVDPRPSVASIRNLLSSNEALILLGPSEHAQAWWSALRGAGARRVFIHSGSAEALNAAAVQLDAVHEGRHWVPPTPCERQG